MFFRRFCVKNDIVMIGFSPFGSPDLPWGQKLPPILEEDTIKSIAESKGRTPALVALRWLLQRGLATTPKVGCGFISKCCRSPGVIIKA